MDNQEMSLDIENKVRSAYGMPTKEAVPAVSDND